VLAKHVAQVFYVLDTTNKRLKVVIPGKRWIVGVENAVDEEEFDQFDEIPPFVTPMIKPRIPSANKASYLRNDHREKLKNLKTKTAMESSKMIVCKICSMCENMTFVWKFDFHWIFVWNMLNVWKYGHLCENLAFIWYLCKIWLFLKCAVSEVLCSVSEGHYT
jgi:hypothetical protein